MSTRDAPHGLTLVEQLRALAGVGENVNTFEIVRDGCRIQVEWSPGSTDSLDLHAPVPVVPSATGGGQGAASAYRGGSARPLVVPRPMSITLREETEKDRRYKAEGVNHEFETGDAGFDARVYIDSPSTDEVIRAVLASPDARAAVLDLLGKDCRSIVIDGTIKGQVSLGIIEFAQRAPDQARAERLVQNLARLALALPPVQSSGRVPVDPAGCPVYGGCGLALLGVVGAPLIYMQASPSRCMQSDDDGTSLVCSVAPECCTPGIMGFAGGALLSLPLMLLFYRVIRGRSDSSTTRKLAMIAVFCVFVEIGILVARFAW